MKQKRTKGFTLIELLAVIVILAIIALIAVPVILNIIDKANKSAFKDTAYGVISAGELYFAEQQLDLNGMTSDITIELPDSRLELKGDVPEGKVTIAKDGKIAIAVQNGRYCVTKDFDDKDVTITEEFETCELPTDEENTGGSGEKTLSDLATTGYMRPSTSTSTATSIPEELVEVPACVTDGSICAAGTPVVIKVNETETQNFYIIKDDGNEVTLIMDRNLGYNVAWYAEGRDNSYGPTTAVGALLERTADWTNIPEREYTYSNGNGAVIATAFTETKRARLITYAEANTVAFANNGTMPIWMIVNLDGETTYGYWTSTAHDSLTENAWGVYFYGALSFSYTDYSLNGVRPVIELSK